MRRHFDDWLWIYIVFSKSDKNRARICDKITLIFLPLKRKIQLCWNFWGNHILLNYPKLHFCPIFFEHYVKKKPNNWFYLYKKCTIKMCIFIQKRHMSFVKKPQLIKWFNLLLLKPTPPQKLLYKPQLFYSNHPFIATSNCGQHRQLGDQQRRLHQHHPSGVQLSSNSTTTSRPKTLKKPEGIIEDIIAEVKLSSAKIIFGRLLSPKKLRHHLQLSWKN